MGATEDRLFERWCRQGDAEALGELFDLASPGLLRLAIHLVGEPAEAEDLVQATFLAAIEQRASVDSSRPVLPWLTAVLSNKAADHKRRTSRSLDVERLLKSVEDEAPHPAEEREVSGELAKAIDALEEPYRQVMILRLRHGLSPADIAHVLERSPGAVRVQLHRAQQKLRGRLPSSLVGAFLIAAAAPRGLAAVRTNVMAKALSVAPAATSAAASATFLGGLVMGKKLAVAIAAGVIAAGAWWLAPHIAALRPERTQTPAESSTLVGVRPEDAQVEGLNLARALPAAGRTGVDPAVEAKPVDSVDESSIRGIVLDALGAPIADAVVVASRHTHDDLRLPTNARGLVVSSNSTKSDANGKFELPVERGRSYQLVGTHAGYAPNRIYPCFGGMELSLSLTQGGRIAGRVFLLESGSGVQGASISIYPRLDRTQAIFTTTSDSSGSFRTDLLPSGAVVVITRTEAGSPTWVDTEIVQDKVTACDIPVKPGVTVVGQVRDSVSAAPIEGATVGRGWNGSSAVRTDYQGRYEIKHVARSDYSTLTASAPGHGRAELPIPGTESDETAVLDFDLLPGLRAEGRVIDEQGQPIEQALVVAVAFGTTTDCLETFSDAAGRFLITDIEPTLQHRLMLKRDGYGTVGYDFPRKVGTEHLIDFGEVVLYPAASIAGVVLDEADLPVHGATVILAGGNTDRGRYVQDTAASKVSPYAGLEDGDDMAYFTRRRSGVTDSLGRFRFGNLAAGAYAVRSPSNGDTIDASTVALLDTGEQLEGLRLVLPTQHIVAGRVVDCTGQPASAITVLLSVGKSPSSKILTGLTDSKGEFSIRVSGPDSVDLYVPTSPSLPDMQRAAAGAGSLCDIVPPVEGLELKLKPADPVRGIVRFASGKAAESMVVRAFDARLGFLDSMRTNAYGEFSLWVLPDRAVTLEVTVPKQEADTASESKKRFVLEDLDPRGPLVNIALPAEFDP